MDPSSLGDSATIAGVAAMAWGFVRAIERLIDWRIEKKKGGDAGGDPASRERPRTNGGTARQTHLIAGQGEIKAMIARIASETDGHRREAALQMSEIAHSLERTADILQSQAKLTEDRHREVVRRLEMLEERRTA